MKPGAWVFVPGTTLIPMQSRFRTFLRCSPTSRLLVLRPLALASPSRSTSGGSSSSFTDINEQSWVHRVLPTAAVPYAALGRWDRPIGTWLLLWPCLWSTSLAAPAGALPDVSLFALFGLGAFAMRGAGCTVNDLWDRDIDRQVERTRTRPLASGALGVPQAIGFLGAQCSVGLGVLLALPPYAVALSFLSVPLVGLYPLAKRITNWPQAVLGLTFNWGALVGWAAVHGSCDWSVVLPLYAGGFWWTLLYDTIYAHQDKHDDAKIGIGSTALGLGDGSDARRWLAAFGVTCTASLGLAGAAAGLHPAFYVGLAGGAVHMGWQVATVDLGSREDCLRKFKSNNTMGLLVLAGIVAGKLLLDREDAVLPEGCFKDLITDGDAGPAPESKAKSRVIWLLWPPPTA